MSAKLYTHHVQLYTSLKHVLVYFIYVSMCLLRLFLHLTDSRRLKSQMWHAWLGARSIILLKKKKKLLLFVLSCVTQYLDFCSIMSLNFLLRGLWEPSFRFYKLLARPAARPGEPDLAAPRLQRVKRCTQRGSLHLYAPYIGRLLLQPTGTWLLAS